MKQSLLIRIAAVGVVAISILPALMAQEMVTIPRVRLLELERKERELERLKGELSAAQGESERLKQEKAEALAKAAAMAAAAPAGPVSLYVAPPLNTLPPLAKGEVVEARDLAAHFRQDQVAAAGHYEGRTFRVQGEIVGFEKPFLTRNYHVLLQTPDRQMRVLCIVIPPEKYSGVYTAKGGTELMGAIAGGGRVRLAKLGDAALIEGRCDGLDGGVVKLNRCALVSVR